MSISHVQTATGGSSTVVTSIAATGSAVGSGNTLCGLVFWNGISTVLTSVTDDQGNAYTIVDRVPDSLGSSPCLSSFYLVNVANAPVTLTATFGSSVTGSQITWDEYSGVPTSATLDGHSGQSQHNPGFGTDAITSGSFTTTKNGDLIYCGAYDGGGTAAAGTGFTIRQNNGGSDGITFISTEDMIQSSAGSVAGTYTDASHGTATQTNAVAIALGDTGGGDTVMGAICL